jgi:hypothetical protein
MNIKVRDLIVCPDKGYRCVRVEGFTSKVHQLFGVCTARMVENLVDYSGSLEHELLSWIELLKAGKEGYLGGDFDRHPCNYIWFKPQLLIAVTTTHQVNENKILLKLGFVPSQPVLNTKYTGGLINWTYALHGFVEGVE